MKAGIAIEAWKLPIFERRLMQAGFEFKVGQFTAETLFITVEAQDTDALVGAIVSAQAEAALKKAGSSA